VVLFYNYFYYSVYIYVDIYHIQAMSSVFFFFAFHLDERFDV